MHNIGEMYTSLSTFAINFGSGEIWITLKIGYLKNKKNIYRKNELDHGQIIKHWLIGHRQSQTSKNGSII